MRAPWMSGRCAFVNLGIEVFVYMYFCVNAYLCFYVHVYLCIYVSSFWNWCKFRVASVLWTIILKKLPKAQQIEALMLKPEGDKVRHRGISDESRARAL